MKIKNYNNFINESGISDINKSYKEQILDIFLKRGYGNHSGITFKNEELSLINTTIIFNKSTDWYSYFDSSKSYLSDKSLHDVIFKFNIANENLEKIREEITHELNHCIEYYNIVLTDKNEPLNHLINIALSRTKIQAKTPFWVFRYAIYLSLDSELNARVSQLYPYLMKFKTIRKDILETELKKTDVWKNYNYLLNDSDDRAKKFLIQKIGLTATLKIINDLNKEIKNVIDEYNEKLVKENKKPIEYKKYEFTLKEITSNNIDDYFKKWFKIIKSSLPKHRDKLYSIIDEVVKDNRPYMESYLYKPNDDSENYEKYLKENI